MDNSVLAVVLVFHHIADYALDIPVSSPRQIRIPVDLHGAVAFLTDVEMANTWPVAGIPGSTSTQIRFWPSDS